jgi:pimeloyl-ACP methyl ester carboxylesterase
MNPFYFGPSDSPLFGLYTLAKGGDAEAPAVLLCYPVGSEYMRAHRAFRQLNQLLNRAGFHVLRFDYSCTGDSAGAGEEASLEKWLDDIDWAIDELQDTAMVEKISVVGLRWGATLAAKACSGREDIVQLILWDPVVSGRAYLDAQLGTPRPEGLAGIEGYPFSEALREEMDRIELGVGSAEGPERMKIMVAEDRAEYREYRDLMRSSGRDVDYEVAPSPGDWSEVDPFGDALIPQRIIRAIVEQLSRGRQI